MKKALSIILMVSFYLIACRESNPITQDEEIILAGRCYTAGLEIFFVDSCSYKFITNFMSSFDSVVVGNYFLGSDFYLYADSGDYNYWVQYFVNDTTIFNIMNVSASKDSLILKLKSTGEKSIEEESQRLSSIKNLEIIKIEEQPKHVFVDVPENTESKWEAIFKEYEFVSAVYIVGVCCD